MTIYHRKTTITDGSVPQLQPQAMFEVSMVFLMSNISLLSKQGKLTEIVTFLKLFFTMNEQLVVSLQGSSHYKTHYFLTNRAPIKGVMLVVRLNCYMATG